MKEDSKSTAKSKECGKTTVKPLKVICRGAIKGLIIGILIGLLLVMAIILPHREKIANFCGTIVAVPCMIYQMETNETSLNSALMEISDAEVEHCLIFVDGKLAYETVGNKYSVSNPSYIDQVAKFLSKEYVMLVHNHPHASCFSCNDLLNASQEGYDLIAVTTSTHHYFLSAPNGWPSQWSLNLYFNDTLGTRFSDQDSREFMEMADPETYLAAKDAGWIEFDGDNGWVNTTEYIAKLAEDFDLEFTVIEHD